MTSSGPNSPGTLVNDASVGSDAWSNPGNAASSNDSYASAIAPSGESLSNYLKATNFGFAIPAGATINGVVVEIEARQEFNLGVVDEGARLVKAGTVGGSNLASGGSSVPYPYDAYITRGGSSNLWGNTLTADDVNHSEFGFVFQIRTVAGNTGYVDHIRMTVHYTPAASGADKFFQFF